MILIDLAALIFLGAFIAGALFGYAIRAEIETQCAKRKQLGLLSQLPDKRAKTVHTPKVPKFI